MNLPYDGIIAKSTLADANESRDLAHLSGFRAQPNQSGTPTLFTKQLCGGVKANDIRARYDNHRPVSECFSLGPLSSGQGYSQDA